MTKGRPKKYDVGTRLGMLTVVSTTEGKGGSQRVLHCVCDCGHTRDVSVNYAPKAIGCRQLHDRAKPRGRPPLPWATDESILSVLYRSYKGGAARRKYPFDLTIGQFDDLIHRECAYCGIPSSNIYVGRYAYNGIDRKDNSLGYSIDNCVPCCSDCNFGKRTKTHEEFIAWAKRVADHNNLSAHKASGRPCDGKQDAFD